MCWFRRLVHAWPESLFGLCFMCRLNGGECSNLDGIAERLGEACHSLGCRAFRVA